MQTNKIFLYLFLLSILSSNIFALEEVLVGADTIDGRTNKFLESDENKLAMIIPATMLIVALIFFAIDFGSIGVIAALLFGLMFVNLIGLLAISVSSIICGTIMGALLLYKLTRI